MVFPWFHSYVEAGEPGFGSKQSAQSQALTYCLPHPTFLNPSPPRLPTTGAEPLTGPHARFWIPWTWTGFRIRNFSGLQKIISTLLSSILIFQKWNEKTFTLSRINRSNSLTQFKVIGFAIKKVTKLFSVSRFWNCS